MISCEASTGVCSSVLPETKALSTGEVVRPNPIGVAILPGSRLAYVDYDSRTLHVQFLNPTTKKMDWQVTSVGFAPYGIASNASGSKVYLTGEKDFGAVCQLGASGSRTACTLSKDLTGFDVAVDSLGAVYVANSTSIQVCDESLIRCASHSIPDGRTMAVGIAVGPGIFISDYFNARILKCSLERGQFNCAEFARSLKIPRAIRLDSTGNLYVAEYNSGRVIRMNPEGREF